MAQSGRIVEVSEATFATEVIARSRTTPVLVDFWAPWCGPCRMLGPILEKLAREPGSEFVLAKVNVDENQNLSWKYQVQGIPAVKAFVNGEVAGEFVGARPESFVRGFLQQLVPEAAADDLNGAMAALGNHDWAAAENGFRAVLEETPEHPAAQLGLARALLARGQGLEAERLLRTIKGGPEFADAEKLRPLADYLVASELTWNDEDEITPLEAQYRRQAALLRRGNVEAALDGLFDVLRVDRRYRKEAARQVALGMIALWQNGSDIKKRYQQELALILF